MQKPRIVFMGTPDFAVGILNALLQNEQTIVGVITAPDKPAGRGRKINQSAVKVFAQEHNLKVLQPTNLKATSFLDELASLNADLQIIVAFRMLPKVVWNMPKLGTFNLHASLLPEYRGAAPINWAIINGETITGVTTFYIDEKIDTGAILLQEEVTIDPLENVAGLHDKLMSKGASLVIATIKAIASDSITAKVQTTSTAPRVAYKIHKETCNINWSGSAQNIFNFIRGLAPYPTAWTTLINGTEATTVKVFESKMELETHNFSTGKIIATKKEMKIAVRNGFIHLLEIQLQGKRRMPVNAILNGLKLDKDAHFR